MTDKQIIIDGVDVSKCPDLLKEYLPACYCSTLDKENQEASCSGCFCLFKIKQYMNNNKLIEDLRYELKYKTAECEALKSESFTREELISLQEKEIEELKEYIQANKPTGICETCTAQTLIENDKYKKALKEIEDISDDYNRVDKTPQYYRDGFDEILNIINKAKED